MDVEALLQKQKAQYEAAWKRLRERFPAKAGRLEKKIAKVAAAARLREKVRSEWTRVFRVNRAFALQAVTLTGLGEDVFFLYLNELLQVLSGNDSAVKVLRDISF